MARADHVISGRSGDFLVVNIDFASPSLHLHHFHHFHHLHHLYHFHHFHHLHHSAFSYFHRVDDDDGGRSTQEGGRKEGIKRGIFL